MSWTVDQPVASVSDGSSFPVRRIYCVGRNYRAQALEMGADPDREPPFFFMKPGDALVGSDEVVPYPPRTADYQHEIELVVAIGKRGRDIDQADAYDHVFAHAVGLDMTRRDLQLEARKAGRPWDMGKGFDRSAPCGIFSPLAETGPLTAGAIRVEVNGAARQASDLSLQIWNVAEVIADLSAYVELMPGDLIFMGTPEGVGPVARGDTLVGSIAGLAHLRITIGD